MKYLLNRKVFMYIGLIVSLVFIYFIFIYKNSVIEKIEYIDRKTGEIRVEKVPGEGYLKWLYYNPFGKITAKTIVANKFLSEYYGTKMKNPSSKSKVNEFITNFGININESQKKDFESFNDFFIRKLNKLCMQYFTSKLSNKLKLIDGVFAQK